MQLEHEHSKVVTTFIRSRLTSLKKQLESLTKMITEKAHNSEALRPALETLTTVKGVADFTAASLLAASSMPGILFPKISKPSPS